jgi:hypothetical protein
MPAETVPTAALRPDLFAGRAALVVGGTGGIAEEYVYDANVVTMRQIQLGYSLPSEWFAGLGVGIQSATVSLVGRNLFYLYNPVENVDPGVSLNRGNAQGLELAGVPGIRSIGFNIDVQF